MSILLPLLIVLMFSLINTLFSILGLYRLLPILSSIVVFAFCFSVGLYFNQQRKRSKTWVLKVIITLILMFCFLVYQGLWPQSLWHPFLDVLIWKSVTIPIIVVWCGWAFFR